MKRISSSSSIFDGGVRRSSGGSTTLSAVGKRIAINEGFEGLEQIHSSPDIFVIHNFLEESQCNDIIARALEKPLEQSPVAYAGWTTDLKDLLELAAKGPVAWLSLIGAWYQVTYTMEEVGGGNQLDLVRFALQNYAILFLLAATIIAAFTKSRADGLKQLRTSTSTTLDDLRDPTSGPTVFVQKAAQLFAAHNDNDNHNNNNNNNNLRRKEASLFEAPTVIRYESGQVLAPHYDANRSAETEDANRGGQTLATLLVYLNDVPKGGTTRFGKLSATVQQQPLTTTNEEEQDPCLTIQPKVGDALLFFPADAYGQFDDRMEHEGCPAIDEKWIARIWRHSYRVPPPFGLKEEALAQIH